jgi:Plavaka transposase
MADFMDLLKAIAQPDFKPEELGDVNWTKVHKQLAEPLAQTQTLNDDQWIDDEDRGWLASSVVIDIPFPTGGRGGDVAQFEVGTLYHQDIVAVIREKLSDAQQDHHLHYKPYQLMWQPEGVSEPMRVYGELYTSDEFLKAEKDVQSLDLPPGDASLERIVLALMFWTDATLLANFGTAKLWPCYLFFGNDSKYRRSAISTGLCKHIAYFLHVCLSSYTRTPEG